MVTTRLSLLNSLFHLNRSMAADAVSLSPPPPSPPSPPIPSPPPPPSRPPPPPPSSWIWPSCNHPRTCSFKVPGSDDAPKGAGATADTPYVELSEPCFSNSSVEESESLSTTSEPSVAGDVVEAVIRGLRSDRLVYEPCGASSMAEEAAAIKKAATSASASAASSTAEVDGRGSVPFEGSVAMALESRDPYKDFKASMEEMVAAQGGAKDWEWLEEMLAWYLQVNGKGNHVFIVGAFLDLLLSLASSTTSSSSNLSSTSSCSSSFSFEIREKLQEKEEDQRKRNRSCPHE